MVVVAYRILVSAPVPFGLIWVFDWVGLGWDWVWRDWGLMGLGLGLGHLMLHIRTLFHLMIVSDDDVFVQAKSNH